MDINQLANEARNSISDYCINECNAYCCRKGYLILNEAEKNITVGSKEIEFSKNNDLKKLDDDKYSLHLGGQTGSCPSLVNNMCMIHKDPARSSTCKDFPIFIEDNNKIRLSPRCPAVKNNQLYAYSYQFVQLGFEINKI